MHLKILQRGGREYLLVVQSYRQDGKVKTRTVETIGYADAYADKYDDPVAHFRAYVARLNAEAVTGEAPIEFLFGVKDTIDAHSLPPVRLGSSIALGCLDALGIKDYFRTHMARERMPAYVGRVYEMLVVERMMHATSKRESWTARASFPRDCDVSFSDVYEALGPIANVCSEIDSCVQGRWRRMAGEPDTSCIYLICGSYAFPIDGGALRASIAMALDKSGMPLGYHVVYGRLGPECFREMLEDLKERARAERAVVVAGGLRELNPSIAEVMKTGDGFAFYERGMMNNPELAEWAGDSTGYTPMGGDVYMKHRRATRILADGETLPVQEIMLRGGGYATSYTHAALVTSETGMEAQDVVQLYRELWRQAEPFQPLEADFSSMPYPTAAFDHISSHFSICYVAFFALRMLRWKMGWQYNAANTADALLRMEGTFLQRNYYLFNYRTRVTDCIEEAVGMKKARRLRTRAELRSVVTTVRDSLIAKEKPM